MNIRAVYGNRFDVIDQGEIPELEVLDLGSIRCVLPKIDCLDSSERFDISCNVEICSRDIDRNGGGCEAAAELSRPDEKAGGIILAEAPGGNTGTARRIDPKVGVAIRIRGDARDFYGSQRRGPLPDSTWSILV
jgi:hypothetical protein